jgi:L-ascorbate metabolism protein UlaG (beta-lactamase superfamily)
MILALLTIALILVVLYSTDFLSSFGASPKGARLERMRRSQNYDGKMFINPVKTNLGLKPGVFWDTAYRWIAGWEARKPNKTIPVIHLNSKSFSTPPPEGLRVTWMGHSSLLIEIDGLRILTDPVWSKRCSPTSIMGPARFHPPPLPLKALPELDAVLISHDHYDHLDKTSVCVLAKTGVRFFMPLGVGVHLEKWGITPNQIVEMDWWESSVMEGNVATLVATPARHFSGRLPLSANPTLWTSWVILGPDHRVFFSGDTGMFPGFEEIGARYGPFDITFIKIGAYDRNWPDIHMNPEQAVEAHLTLKGDILLPIHWGTFNLAFHAWNEPIKRLIQEAKTKSVRFVAPVPGQLISPTRLPTLERWWE